MGEQNQRRDDDMHGDDLNPPSLGEDRERWLENLVATTLADEHPVPTEAVDAAAALFDFVNFDAAIAEVLESELAVRSQGTRSRTFKWTDRCSLILESVASAGKTLLTGVVVPAISDAVTLRTPDGTAHEVDLVAGTFELATPAPMVRLELDQGSFVTPWFRLA